MLRQHWAVSGSELEDTRIGRRATNHGRMGGFDLIGLGETREEEVRPETRLSLVVSESLD